MKRMKAAVVCLMLAAALLLPAGCGQRKDVVRLHVIANSDSPDDQDIKFQVRDGLYAMLGGQLAKSATAEEADAVIKNNIDRIKEMAEEIIRENGQGYSAAVNMGAYAFPEKVYAGTVYPEGEYQAVQVVLGEGAGQNWWCVMFPPLCFVDVDGQENPDPADASLEDGVEFKSLFEEWYRELFGGKQ